MKKIILLTCSIIAIVGIGLSMVLSYMPKYSSYKEQKDYAKTMFSKAQEREDMIFFAPTIGETINATFSKVSWKKSLLANLYLIKAYPKEAIEDIDVLGRIGDSYFYLKKFNEAREWYEKELNGFKKKYFKNKTYWEREGLTDKQALTEELRYHANIQESIASCYTAVGEYKKGIEMHEATLGLMQDATDLDEHQRESIFKQTFVKMGKLYKTVLKDYKRAFETYDRMMKAFPKPFYTCEAEIYIGDTYLAMGDAGKAKETYQAVLDKYKYPGSPTNYGEADKRLKALKDGTSFVSLDRIVYEVKDGKVKMKY